MPTALAYPIGRTHTNHLTYLIGPMRTGRPSVPYRRDAYRIGRRVPRLQQFVAQAVLERANDSLYFTALLAMLRGSLRLQGMRTPTRTGVLGRHTRKYIQINWK